MVDFEVCGDGQISSKSFVYGINRDIKFFSSTVPVIPL